MAKTTLYNFSATDRRGLQNFIRKMEDHVKHATPQNQLNRTQFGMTSYVVQLTGRGTAAGSFKFAEVKYDTSTSQFIPKPNGITEQQAGHAFDVSGLSTIPIGAVVTISPDYSRRGNGIAVYVFDYPSKYIWARITGASSVSANKWRYSWSEQVLTDSTFNAPDNPLTGSTSTGYAINSLENGNSASGIQGNGINVDNLPDGFSLLPASTGSPIIQLHQVGSVYVFTLANPVDGECS